MSAGWRLSMWSKSDRREPHRPHPAASHRRRHWPGRGLAPAPHGDLRAAALLGHQALVALQDGLLVVVADVEDDPRALGGGDLALGAELRRTRGKTERLFPRRGGSSARQNHGGFDLRTRSGDDRHHVGESQRPRFRASTSRWLLPPLKVCVRHAGRFQDRVGPALPVSEAAGRSNGSCRWRVRQGGCA